MTASLLSCQDVLTKELAKRQSANRNYSLRDFAGDLELSPSYLSRIMSGVRQPGSNTVRAIAIKLGLNGTQSRRLILNRDIKKTKTGKIATLLKDELADLDSQVTPYGRMQSKQFSVFSRWFYPVILELIQIDNPPVTIKDFAKRIGVSLLETELAFERLVALNLIKNESGIWQATEPFITSGDVPSATIRDFHAQHMDRAKLALTQQDFHSRDITGTTVGTSPEKIAEAKIMIRNFRRELVTFLGDGPKTTVYQIALQLFELTPSSPKKSH